jgi:peptide chain release factor subunit 1
MTNDLQSTLQTLTAQPGTDQPFLSVYLDWTPDGTGQRQAPRILDQELNRIADRLADRGANLDSFNADRERIMEYVTTEAPDDARGLAIFACDAEGVWVAQPLQAPVENQIVEDRYPHLFNLARIIDDYETYAVVLADAQESRMFVISLNTPKKAAETEAEEEISRVQVGGWSQARFQRHTDHVIKAHTKDIAEELGRIIKRYDVEHVIIAGNDSIKGIVMDSLPDSIKEKLIDYINLDIEGNIQSIMEAIEPMMREVERKQEAGDVAELEEQAYSQGLGVVVIADTALALSKGQVRTLLMLQSFGGAGGECPNCGTLRADQRSRCPYDGAELLPIDLREVFTARALQQSAGVQIVKASEYLDQHEGVGALLRYRDTEQARAV